MLSDGQVAVLDGAFSFYKTATSSSSATKPDHTLLQPIPKLNDLVDRVIDDLAKDKALRTKLWATGKRFPLIYSVGTGFRCSDALARIAARRLHENVLEFIKESAA